MEGRQKNLLSNKLFFLVKSCLFYEGEKKVNIFIDHLPSDSWEFIFIEFLSSKLMFIESL